MPVLRGLMCPDHESLIADVYPPELDDYLWKVKQTYSVDLPRYWTWIVTKLEVEAEVAGIDCSWADKKVVKI